MIDIDFISGNDSDPDSTSSYDAIALRFKEDSDAGQKVVVIDGGFSDVGDDVVNFITKRYGASKIDLMISTHPDNDHLNGLLTIIQQFPVDELLIHQPQLYRDNLNGFTNLDNLDLLLGYAVDAGTTISDPFVKVYRFNGRLRVLGPDEDYYRSLLNDQLDPAAKAMFAIRSGLVQASTAIKDLAGKALGQMPDETLDDSGITSPRNSSSVITLLEVDGRRHMFTGDAGIEALEYAADEYESIYGNFSSAPIQFFQAPHHGSHRNLGKSILNRIFGEPGASHGDNHTVFIHAARASKKHPSPKVTNALIRRGCSQERLGVTNGIGLWHHFNSESRDDYSSITPYPILPEE
ncbi:MAG TPA: hypothetical protein VLF39_02120 [Candidatus Saccharimonadales bacterium]|nr:hypothetical protein [Candidatus Saccharimonadales bacterium]